MSSSRSYINKEKFSSTSGNFTVKDREGISNYREQQISGTSPVTNILYFNYNNKESDKIETKLKPSYKSKDEASPTLQNAQNNSIGNKYTSRLKSSEMKFFPFMVNKSTRFSNDRLFNTIENERLRDEILKLKVENNKIKKEHIELKAENKRAEEEYKKSVRVLEDILKEGGSAAHDVLNNIMKRNNQIESNIDFEDNFETEDNKGTKFNLSTTSFFRLKEMFVINSLKNQIAQLKQLNKKQEQEIAVFKSNSRVTKLAKLEQNFNNSTNELAMMKSQYEKVRVQYEDTLEKYKEVLEEKNYFKSMMQKYKSQFEETKNNLKSLKEENSKLKEIRKMQDERIIYLSKITKPTNFLSRAAEKEKESHLNTVEKNEFLNLETKAKELERTESRLKEALKANEDLSEKLELSNKKIYSLEKLKEENKKMLADLKDILNTLEKQKENIALEKNILENEYNVLKKNTNNELDELETLKFAKLNIENELDTLKKESDKKQENLLNSKFVLEKELENLKNDIKKEKLENEVSRQTLNNEREVIQKEFEHFKIESFKEKENLKYEIEQNKNLIEIKSKEFTELLNKFNTIEKEKQENILLKENIEKLEKDKQKIQTEYDNLLATIETNQKEKEKENSHLENIEEHSDESKSISCSSSSLGAQEKEAKTTSIGLEEKGKNKSATTTQIIKEAKVPIENISPIKRNSDILIQKMEINESVPRISEKRISLKDRLHSLIFDNKKIFTLKPQESESEKIVEKKQPIPEYVPPKSEVIQTSSNFIINLDISEPQTIDPTKSFFVKDPEAEEKKKMIKNEIKNLPPAFKKMKTIERVFIEKVSNLEDFDKMLEDPQLSLLLKVK